VCFSWFDNPYVVQRIHEINGYRLTEKGVQTLVWQTQVKAWTEALISFFQTKYSNGTYLNFTQIINLRKLHPFISRIRCTIEFNQRALNLIRLST